MALKPIKRAPDRNPVRFAKEDAVGLPPRTGLQVNEAASPHVRVLVDVIAPFSYDGTNYVVGDDAILPQDIAYREERRGNVTPAEDLPPQRKQALQARIAKRRPAAPRRP